MKKLLPIGYRWLATGIENTEVATIHANDPTQNLMIKVIISQVVQCTNAYFVQIGESSQK